MLVLTRGVQQSIMIGDDIVIRVLQISPNGTVRLGISAPRETTVHREEIYRRIQDAANQEAEPEQEPEYTREDYLADRADSMHSSGEY